MSSTSEPQSDAARNHYSYSHYASRDVAEGFDALLEITCDRILVA